jgi:hypothetical protein
VKAQYNSSARLSKHVLLLCALAVFLASSLLLESAPLSALPAACAVVEERQEIKK